MFNGEMVRAILEGRKTQTRRVVNLDWLTDWDKHDPTYGPYFQDEYGDPHLTVSKSPFGQAGDRLWVRETFQPLWATLEKPDWKTGEGYELGYPATDGISEYNDMENDEELTIACKPSIHMPRWASRITLEVTEVRVERLQDISEKDAYAEGVLGEPDYSWPSGAPIFVHIPNFARLWDSINGKPRKNGADISWAANPWVWVVKFQPLENLATNNQQLSN